MRKAAEEVTEKKRMISNKTAHRIYRADIAPTLLV
jgi:hypothetical protein